MKNDKMIIIFGNYGNKYTHIFCNVCDTGIELSNNKGSGLALSWTVNNYLKPFNTFYHLKPDEGFQIWDYDDATYKRILKEINNG